MSPVRDFEVAELRRRLLAVEPGGARRTAVAVTQATEPTVSISVPDAVALVEIAAAVARDGSQAEFATFLRTGRLPEVIALSPRAMEHVRGGRVILTTQRGIAPELVLTGWLSRTDRTL